MAIYDLFNQLSKTVHDIATHQDAKDVLADFVWSAQDVINVVPGVSGATPTIVADVVNTVANTLFGSFGRITGPQLENKTTGFKPGVDGSTGRPSGETNASRG